MVGKSTLTTMLVAAIEQMPESDAITLLLAFNQGWAMQFTLSLDNGGVTECVWSLAEPVAATFVH
jgi:hypothetical protein